MQGLSLRENAELGLHSGIMDVVDVHLSSGLEKELPTKDESSYKQMINCLTSLLRLGMSCSQELMPSARMSTAQMIKELHGIKESLL